MPEPYFSESAFADPLQQIVIGHTGIQRSDTFTLGECFGGELISRATVGGNILVPGFFTGLVDQLQFVEFLKKFWHQLGIVLDQFFIGLRIATALLPMLA